MRLDDPLLTGMIFFLSCSPCIFKGNMAFTLIVSPFCYMQEIVSQQHENKDTSTTTVIDDVGAEGPNNCQVVDPMGQLDDDFVLADGNTATSIQQEEESNFVRTLVDRGTQKSMPFYHILVEHGKAVLVIIDCAGHLILVDSHQHSNKGALVARSVSCVGHQATYFAIFLNQVHLQTLVQTYQFAKFLL